MVEEFSAWGQQQQKNSTVKVFQILLLYLLCQKYGDCTKPIISIILKGRYRTRKSYMRLFAKTINNVKQKQGWTSIFQKNIYY